jgi:hypothetical protein
MRAQFGITKCGLPPESVVFVFLPSTRYFKRGCRKSPQADSWGDAEKNDLTECATINDLTIMRGHETAKNHPFNYTEGFFDSLSSNR